MTNHLNQSALPERTNVVVIGAGPGGILMGIRLLDAGFDDFVLLEREAVLGGTWQNNRYPGLQCDVPSDLYSYSFELKPDWSRPYGDRKEIVDYLGYCAEKYGISGHIHYRAQVSAAQWSDKDACWHIELADGRRLTSQVLVSALGMFNEVNIPDIPGLDRFKGQSWHTAQWPDNVDVTGKKVAIVGSAATAVQLAPTIAEKVDQLYLYQRTANWVMPKEDTPYTEEELAQRIADPSICAAKREEWYGFCEANVHWNVNQVCDYLRQTALHSLGIVRDDAVREKLYPRLPLGSQRPLFSNDFYPIFNRPNVELVTDGISEINATGIRSNDGTQRDVDILILATGFRAYKFLSVIDVKGRNGLDLQEFWSDGPQAYLGITVPHFPNLFMIYGPNTNNGSLITYLEMETDYIIRKLTAMRDQGADCIEVRQDAYERYNEDLQAKIASVAAWQVEGSKYYRFPTGRNVTHWPDKMAVYKELSERDDSHAYELSSGSVSERLAVAS